MYERLAGAVGGAKGGSSCPLRPIGEKETFKKIWCNFLGFSSAPDSEWCELLCVHS